MTSAKIVKVDPLDPREDYLKEAADILARGGLVIIPTETVYGIAANMSDKNALERLYTIKKRPQDKPFSLHIAKKDSVEEFAKEIPAAAYKLMDKFWPGPLTLILKSKDGGTIGIRMPDHRVALKIISLSGVPIACPSANLSGNPAPFEFSDAIKDFKGLVDYALDCGPTKFRFESSVVDLTNKPEMVTREGALKSAEIENVLKNKTILFICTGNSCRSVMAQALLQKKLRENNRRDVEVLSAGVMASSGLGATAETKEILEQEGIDVSGHFSQQVTSQMLKRSDIVLLMERAHENAVLKLAPEVKNRVFLLKEFAKINDNNLDIADPIARPMDFYSQTFSVIKDAIDRIANII